MSENRISEQRSSKAAAAFILTLVAMIAILFFFAGAIRQFLRESFMQRVTSAHYVILYERGALSVEAMRQFATERDVLFTTLDNKLGGAPANTKIRIIFYANSSAPKVVAGAPREYVVTGTTIRAKLNGRTLQLDPAADAEAILYAAWGKPGNSRIAQWTAMALVGDWHGEEIGMAAAGAEQTLGHESLSSLINPSSSEISSPDDRALLGAAWVSEIAEFGGSTEVRKLYSAELPRLDENAAAKALGTTPMELDRKWQLWMYAYLAGMPSGSSMPMNMQIPTK